jgi:hypothetical protein
VAFLSVAAASVSVPVSVGARDAPHDKEARMDITLTPHMIQALVALVAGILILIVPRVLNYVVAFYLILFGLIGLFPNLLA